MIASLCLQDPGDALFSGDEDEDEEVEVEDDSEDSGVEGLPRVPRRVRDTCRTQ